MAVYKLKYSSSIYDYTIKEISEANTNGKLAYRLLVTEKITYWNNIITETTKYVLNKREENFINEKLAAGWETEN